MTRTYAYYNECDKKAADWLRQLIKNGSITNGVVDERSMLEVTASDVREFRRVHWCAGIGTWDYALNQSGWGDRPVWTASLPCQPFSTAGKGRGKEDERHLIPHYIELVRECNPVTQFGEQVESAIRYGWLDDLQANMEAEGYTVGCCVLGAHSIGAPHIRQRLYWVADTKNQARGQKFIRESNEPQGETRGCCASGGLGDTKHEQYQRRISGHNEEFSSYEERAASKFARPSSIGRVGNADSNGCEPWSKTTKTARQRDTFNSANWDDCEWIKCADGKQRPIKPGIFPLVDGSTRGMVPGGNPIEPNDSAEARAMRLKGYGNAIVAPLAIEFISAFMDVQP